MFVLLGGVFSVVFLWTFIAGFLLTKDERDVLYSYYFTPQQTLLKRAPQKNEIEFLPSTTERITQSNSMPNVVLCNSIPPIYFQSLTHPVPNPFFECALSPSINFDKKKEILIQPLQRTKVSRKSSPLSGRRDTDYHKKVTTRKIIDKILVRAKTQITYPNNNDVGTLYFLSCHTKADSFIVMQSSRSLIRMYNTLKDIYSVNLLNVPNFHNSSKREIDRYFKTLLSNLPLRAASEIVQPLLKNIYKESGPTIQITADL